MNYKKSIQDHCPVCLSKKIVFSQERGDDRYGYLEKHKIYSCQVCSAFFLFDPIISDDLGKLYGKHYPSLQKTSQSVFHTIARHFPFALKLFRLLTGTQPLIENVPNGSKVLDVGCGYYPELLNVVDRKQLNWYGLEVNEQVVNKIREDGLFCYQGTPLTCKIPEKFDCILLSQVIEHQNDIRKNIMKLVSLLKADGKIYILTPNTDSKELKKDRENWLHWHTPYHTVIFNKKSIKYLANVSKLMVEKYTTFTPTDWHVLQKKFKAVYAKKNTSLQNKVGIFDLLIDSFTVRLLDLQNKDENECMYCVLRKK